MRLPPPACALGVLLSVMAAVGADAQSGPSRFESVRLPTADGGVVVADRYGAGENAVVLVHGGRYTRGSWRGLAGDLAARGWLVLAIDLRGYGESVLSRPPVVGQPEEALDVLAAVSGARRLGAREVCVLGASLGGGAAGAAALASGPAGAAFTCLVLLSPTHIPDLRAQGVRQTILLAALDTTARGTLRLTAHWEEFRRNGRSGCLRIFDSHAHGQAMLSGPDSAQVRQAIDSALAKRGGC